MGNSEKDCAFGTNLNQTPERRSRTPDYSPVYTPAFCGPDPPDPLDRGEKGIKGGGSREWGKSVNMDSRGSVLNSNQAQRVVTKKRKNNF